jgi:hypothetical protein
MAVVRDVSSWRDASGKPIENYHTSRKFAEIFGLVPTVAVALDDIALIPVWLEDRFERGMVGHALDENALPRFVQSELSEDWDKAVEILRHCTAVGWQPAPELGDNKRKPTSAVRIPTGISRLDGNRHRGRAALGEVSQPIVIGAS